MQLLLWLFLHLTPQPQVLPSLLTHLPSDKPLLLPDHGINLTFAKGHRVCSA